MKNTRSHRKIKVFFLTYYPPTPTMGGAMAFYRHFIEHDDFDLFVATDDETVRQYNPSYKLLVFKQPALLERMLRTRWFRFVHSYKHLVAGRFISPAVLRAAQEFDPDFIFTIAGSWGWTTLMAQQLSQRLQVPLVGSFNDWFDFSSIIHPWARPRPGGLGAHVITPGRTATNFGLMPCTFATNDQSQHYVHWMRHHFYRDALRLRMRKSFQTTTTRLPN
jgi:hypothetical protein